MNTIIVAILISVPAITILILTALYAALDAVQDAISHNPDECFLKGFKRDFWDPRVSWKNKYKEGVPEYGPKFFGSTTFLVWVTDLWHLCKFVKMNLLWGIVAICTSLWWAWPLGVVLQGALFELFYNIFRK